MRNGQTSEDGNDASFDNVEVLDASPQLDKSFSPAVLNVGAPSQLTFTITNTSELAAKDGWAFTDTLPSGLVVATPAAAATTCTQPTTIKASAGDGTIAVAGNPAAGMNYCTVTVNVTSVKGSYTNGPQDITAETASTHLASHGHVYNQRRPLRSKRAHPRARRPRDSGRDVHAPGGEHGPGRRRKRRRHRPAAGRPVVRVGEPRVRTLSI